MSKHPQFGVMYHLTGSQPDQWQRDFDALADGGFHRVVLWEMNNELSSIVTALDFCAERALNVYSLPYNPVIFARVLAAATDAYDHCKCVGIDGQTLEFYNPFHRDFRREVLMPYLADVVAGIGQHKALAGYFLDDIMDAESMISYTEYDAAEFRVFLRGKYDSLQEVAGAWGTNYTEWSQITPPRIMLPWREGWRKMWDDWCEARQRWWLEWSDDVLSVFKASRQREIVLGDDWFSVRMGRDVTGGFTPAMAEKFDAFSFDYTGAIDYLDAGMTNIDRDLAMARDLAGTRKLTVFLKAAAQADEPFPAMSAVIAQSQRCLDNGIAGIDYYVFRAAPDNYAFHNCLGNQPGALRELSAFVRQHG